MRYAVFTDIHANLEALEAVLARIDELAQQEPIEQIWFLGDLVGYGPNPNECITKLRERTDAIIAGNHDWAAVGKIDLEDFSAAARTSAEWTAEQLTEEHREFLKNLPERIRLKECTLVHGSPYGPLWEYLTSEVLAERSFQYFTSRYCFVGHTHVPVIFQQPDTVAQTPTIPLTDTEQREIVSENDLDMLGDDEETQKVAAIRPTVQTAQETTYSERVHIELESSLASTQPIAQAHDEEETDIHDVTEKEGSSATSLAELKDTLESSVENVKPLINDDALVVLEQQTQNGSLDTTHKEEVMQSSEISQDEPIVEQHENSSNGYTKIEAREEEPTSEERISNVEDRLNSEVEELLALLGLSQSMVQVTNEMLVPPEGEWHAPEGYRAIVNPGGVGQPRDGDPRAAFMIYDTERGFTFYRIAYNFEKTQEKILKAGLPSYLAARLGYGR
ncbi:MAG: hypothetical protein NVS4B12_22100 [Ktedonobacteraceae bacterium]